MNAFADTNKQYSLMQRKAGPGLMRKVIGNIRSKGWDSFDETVSIFDEIYA